MRKKLFSRNNLVKISAISLTCALVFIPVSSHINSLSTVHADNSVSISSVDTSDSNEQTSDNDEQSDEKTADTDNSSDNTVSNTTGNKADSEQPVSGKNTSQSKKTTIKKTNTSTASTKKGSSKKNTQSKKNKNKNQEPKHYKPIIGKTVTVTMKHLQKKLNKISSVLQTAQSKASRTKRVILSKKKQLSSINTLKDNAIEETNCVTVSDVFEPSQSLKSYAKQYDSSLSIYLNQNVSSKTAKTSSDDNTVLPDFEKISGLMDTVSIKKNIKHSKKAIKSSINKNTTKVKNMQKKIKDTKKVKNTVSKYVIVSINSNNIFEPSNVSTKTLKNALEGTNLKELAPAFVKAEKKYGINAIAMTSIAALESGWGKSKRAVKDNNLTGLGVYSDSAKGINADTKEKNILMTAERLATHYSKPGQTFYHGTGFDGVNKKYSASKTWGWKCENIAFRIMNKIANPGIESLE